MIAHHRDSMTRRRTTWGTFLLCFVLIRGIAAAQAALDSQTIVAGGLTSTGGAYTLVAALGQPGVGTLSGGPYSVTSGFWGAFGAQPPAPPGLLIHRTATSVVLSWPVSTVNYQLQERPSLSSTGSWSLAALSRTTNSGRILVTIPSALGSRFYRLKSE